MAILHVQPAPSEVVAELADVLVTWATEAIQARGRFTWALSGGSTPQRLYALLHEEPWLSRFPWASTDLYWDDERDVPPTHGDSNFGAANRILLRHLPKPPHAIHRWITEYQPPAALADYRTKLYPWLQDGLPQLDLVLLGIGPEGHTASLFPESPALDSRDWVAHVWVKIHRSWRFTMTLPVINHARHVAFLVTGKDKRAIVQTIRQSPPNVHWPASLVQPTGGSLHWFLDEAALPGSI